MSLSGKVGSLVAALALSAGFVLATGIAQAGAPAEVKAGKPVNKVWPTPTLPLPKSVAKIDGQPATIDRIPFGEGETATYAATWGGISVGNATMEVETGATFEGKPAIHLKGAARSSRSFSLFYSIKDAGESWIDPAELFTLGFVSDQSEGSNQDYQRWVMDYANGLAHRYRAHRKNDGTMERYDCDFPVEKGYVQDAASMLYFYRAFDLKVGQKLTADVYTSKEMWTLEVKAVGEEKNVKVPAGTFDCLKVEPRVLKDGKAQDKGNMTVWVSADEHRIPVKIVTQVQLGSINAQLVSFKQGATVAKDAKAEPKPEQKPDAKSEQKSDKEK